MITYDNYSDKHSHLKISEEEMRRKYTIVDGGQVV